MNNPVSPSPFMQANRMTASVAIALILLAQAGCMSAGNETLRKETEVSVQQKVLEGKTTKAEVRAMFGSPATTSFTDGGLEIWNYELSNMKADVVNYIPLVGLLGSSASGTRKTLVVLFDDKGVVKRYSMSESPVNVKTGVFNNE
jgi:outer membrane protein assembly factor BamE (lipoprotein component of BamABCDE complex)